MSMDEGLLGYRMQRRVGNKEAIQKMHHETEQLFSELEAAEMGDAGAKTALENARQRLLEILNLMGSGQ